MGDEKTKDSGLNGSSGQSLLIRKYNFKMAVFWVVATCSLVKVYRHSRASCYPDDWGNKYL
jgi:hypothetical protein